MKRLLATIMIFALLISYGAVSTFAKTAYPFGDIDTDKTVSINDATDIQLFVASIISINNISKKLADVDGDGIVTVMDSTTVQMYLAKIIDVFPAQSNSSYDTSVDNGGYYNQIIKP